MYACSETLLPCEATHVLNREMHHVKLASWMYISRSLVDPDQYQFVLDGIVEAACRKNERLDVTGCLISVRTNFAQILEGPPDAVAELKRCIQADKRHTDIRTIEIGQILTRRFSDWSLAYAGPSVFVQRITDEMLTNLVTSSPDEPVNPLLYMMEEFTARASATRH
jgi:hypothetical protein